MRQFMERFDLLVTPAVAVPAFEARPAGHTPMTPEAMLGWTPFSYPFNLTQQPACTIPCGLTSDGLPIGLQLVGPMFADAARAAGRPGVRAAATRCPARRSDAAGYAVRSGGKRARKPWARRPGRAHWLGDAAQAVRPEGR